MSQILMYFECKEGQCVDHQPFLKRKPQLSSDQILLQDDCLLFLETMKQEFEKRFEKPDYFVKINLDLRFSFRTEVEMDAKKKNTRPTKEERLLSDSVLQSVLPPPPPPLFFFPEIKKERNEINEAHSIGQVYSFRQIKAKVESQSLASELALSSAFCLRIEKNPPLPLFDGRNTIFTLARTEKQLQDWLSKNIYTSQKQCPNSMCQAFHDSKLMLVHFHFSDHTLQVVTAVSLVVWVFVQKKLIASVVTVPTKGYYSMTAKILNLLACPWLIKLNLRKYPKAKLSSFYRISFVLNLIKPQVTVNELKKSTVVDLIQWGQQTFQNVPFCPPNYWEKKEIPPKALYLERSLMLASLNLVAFGFLGIASFKLNDLVTFSNLSYFLLLRQLEIFQRKVSKSIS